MDDGGQTEAGWEEVIERCQYSVVVLRFTRPRGFDTSSAPSSGVATGFVVDVERGLILTNRHVVSPGPLTAYAVFQNQEETPVTAIYRDPVHDFGFFRYQPSAVKYVHPLSLPLSLSCRVGMKVRVIGNDAGEKLSILHGTLARLDRAAPNYGRGKYNDFNTFYYQAASSTSGGSSGSPVLDIHGNAIALNAGSKTKAASSFYLPLDRVVRVLRLIQEANPLVCGSCTGKEGTVEEASNGEGGAPAGAEAAGKEQQEKQQKGASGCEGAGWKWSGVKPEDVPRGTMQVIFTHTPFDETRRLGFREESEALFRETFREEKINGLLVVNQVVPGGTGSEAGLMTGDVLKSIQGRLLHTFVVLEEILDTHVGQCIPVVVERGSQEMEMVVAVECLHSITPSSFYQVSRSVLHSTSYMQARNFNVPVKSAFLVSSGYMFARGGVPDKAILKRIDNEDVSDIDSAIRVLGRIPDGKDFTVKFVRIQAPDFPISTTLVMDRLWHTAAYYVRNDCSGRWDRTLLPPPPPTEPSKPVCAKYAPLSKALPDYVSRAARSLVVVRYHVVICIDGLSTQAYLGTGVIVSKRLGLVLVDRNTVPHALGDAFISFGGTARLHGRVVFVHPVQNFSILQYDPSLLLPESNHEEVDFDPVMGSPGDAYHFVGLSTVKASSRGHTVVNEVKLTKLQELDVRKAYPPLFRATNTIAMYIDLPLHCEGAILVGRNGKVAGFYCSFSEKEGDEIVEFEATVPSPFVVPSIEVLTVPERHRPLRHLELELSPLSIIAARNRGLSEERIACFQERHEAQLLSIRAITQGTNCSALFITGDILLAIDGELVSSFLEVERATQAQFVNVTLLRDGEERDLRVETSAFTGILTSQVIMWAGWVLQAPHREVLTGVEQQCGVYVSRYFFGSPAHRYKAGAAVFLTEIDGMPTPNMKELRKVLEQVPDDRHVRVHTKTLSTRLDKVTCLKPDYHWWPTCEYKLTPGGRWCMAEIRVSE